MEVSSILEAYTIAYGWNVYRMFFVWLVVIGAPLYPLITMLMDLAAGYTERGGDPVQLIRAAFFRYVVWFLVLIAGLIPSVPLDMSTAQIRDNCGVTELSQNENVPNQEFKFVETKVPVAPWVAMQLASGLRAVVSRQLPCVVDVTATNQALRNLDISAAEDPAKLNAEQQRFTRECHGPAVQHYYRTIQGGYGQAAANRMRELSSVYAGVGQTSKAAILALPSSTFLRNNFYQKPAYCEGLADTAVMFQACMGLPYTAAGPVDQIVGRDTSLLSSNQKSVGETIPTCSEWFDTPDVGLRDRLFAAAEDKLKAGTEYVSSNPRQYVSVGLSPTLSSPGLVERTTDWVSSSLDGGSETYRNFMVDRLYTNQSQASNLLSGQHRSNLNTVIGIGSAGAIAGVFGFDVAETVAQDAIGFYTSAMLFKIASSFLLPLLLMALFMFWGFYLVISRMNGDSLMQGLIMIFVLSIIPAIWAIANHIDDQLFVAMFPKSFSIADVLTEPSDQFERLLLDIVSTFFYTILPLTLIYVVIAAGGERQTASAYRDATSDPSRSGGGAGGNRAGGVLKSRSAAIRKKIGGGTKK